MFDNNCPESMNASLKTWMENKRKDVSQVVNDIQGFVMKQHHDIGKAFTEIRSIRLKGRVQQCKNASKLLGSKSLQNEGSFLTMSQLFQ